MEPYSDWIEKLRVAYDRRYCRDQTPDSLALLVRLARRFMPTKIIELGTGWGLSLRAWVHAGTGAQITTVDNSGLKGIAIGYEAQAFNLSMVTAIKADVRGLQAVDLWDLSDRVLLYCDVHGSDTMLHILDEFLPKLPHGSLVIVDDIWASEFDFTLTNEAGFGRFFESKVAGDIDPEQPHNQPRTRGRYWESGLPVVGFAEVTELMDYMRQDALDCRFEAKTMWFYVGIEPLTIFTTCKPFQGETWAMQRNAIKSWTLLHPRPEIIVFGDDEGAAETASVFGIHHEPILEPKYTPPRVDVLFGNAELVATNDLLLYINADIIMDPRVAIAAQEVQHDGPFLLTGLRWDLMDWENIGVGNAGWWEELQKRLEKSGQFHASTGADYFLFRKGLYRDIPHFYIGQSAWDNWLIMDVVRRGLPVVDATKFVTAVHQGLTRCDIEDPRYKHNQELWQAFDPKGKVDGTMGTAQWALGPDGKVAKRSDS